MITATNEPICKLMLVSRFSLVKFKNSETIIKWDDELTGINSVIPWIKERTIISNIINFYKIFCCFPKLLSKHISVMQKKTQ